MLHLAPKTENSNQPKSPDLNSHLNGDKDWSGDAALTRQK